jgi:hypothetical protein
VISFYRQAIAVFLAILAFGPGICEAGENAKTRIIVLGVSHSGQLISERNSPAQLAAFVHRLHPDAICVERAPELFARGDQYEFTYEIQNVVMPLAQRDHIALCPFDWEPPVEDQRLGFGVDLDTPPEIRAPSDFQGFLFFPDASALKRDLFEADNKATLDPYIDFASKAAADPSRDLPRRMFLYRTFLQAQHIRAAARAHRGGTVLVVVGEFHKHDLEANLSGSDFIEIVAPSSLGHPSAEDVAAATTPEQRAAILSFNLLGRQAETGNVDWGWVERVLADFERAGATGETRLFRLRLAQLHGHLAADRAAAAYIALARATPRDAGFTWTGVKDPSRLDSYFDPYGNLGVADRALLEAARSTRTSKSQADAMIERLAATLSPRKARQLMVYWKRDASQPSAALTDGYR